MAGVIKFKQGDSVIVDGGGTGVVENLISGNEYLVTIDGTDILAKLDVSRLKLIDNVQQTAPSRFVPVCDKDIDELISAQENKNTARKTQRDVALLREFLAEHGESREIQNIPPVELNEHLCKFVIAARKIDGSQFETTTLRSITCSIDRHLKGHNYGYSLRDSIDFNKYRAVMASKQKELKSLGKGNLPNRSNPITDQEIELLWEHKQLGSFTPQSILNSLWFHNTVHFGLRGSDEHRQMQWGDIELMCDGTGTEYLEFNERSSKTRQGADRQVRDVIPKMWAIENKNRCPVEIYKLYRNLRPLSCSDSHSPFYIACTTIRDPPLNARWFKCQSVGIHKLEKIMKNMTKAVGIPENRKLTNHSARKHLVQKLSDNNVHPSQIMQITGHKNIHSINNYSHINSQQHKAISSVLSHTQSRVNENSTSLAMIHAPQAVAIPNVPAHSSTVSVSSKRDHFQSVFGSSAIQGGTFNVTINNYSAPAPKRRMILESDSD